MVTVYNIGLRFVNPSGLDFTSQSGGSIFTMFKAGDVRMSKTIICLSATALLIMGGCCGKREKNTCGIIQFSSTKAGVVKAMTFNIRVDTFLDGFNGWNSRRQIVCDVLAGNAADVIGLQEALDSQVENIQQAMPQYSNYMAGRNDGMQKGESCSIFYRNDRFVRDDCGTFWFSDTPEKPSKDWGALWPRICSWVHLIEKETGSGFYVYNVHLDVFSQNSREKSVELLAKRIAARKNSDPFIVMGDFNMEVDNPAMAHLQNIGMVDAWQAMHPGESPPGTHHNFNGHASGAKIDHIPICENSTALEVKIDQSCFDGRYPSDHFPVIATISLAASPTRPIVIGANPQKPLNNQKLKTL